MVWVGFCCLWGFFLGGGLFILKDSYVFIWNFLWLIFLLYRILYFNDLTKVQWANNLSFPSNSSFWIIFAFQYISTFVGCAGKIWLLISYGALCAPQVPLSLEFVSVLTPSSWCHPAGWSLSILFLVSNLVKNDMFRQREICLLTDAKQTKLVEIVVLLCVIYFCMF